MFLLNISRAQYRWKHCKILRELTCPSWVLCRPMSLSRLASRPPLGHPGRLSGQKERHCGLEARITIDAQGEASFQPQLFYSKHEIVCLLNPLKTSLHFISLSSFEVQGPARPYIPGHLVESRIESQRTKQGSL